MLTVSYLLHVFQTLDQAQALKKLESINLISKQFLQLNVYFAEFWPTLMTDQPAMTTGILLSNLGGVLSLWLGVTIMAGFEFLELLYSLIVTSYSKGKKREKRSSMENVDENADHDLQQVSTL
jgi:hypothetical protein